VAEPFEPIGIEKRMLHLVYKDLESLHEGIDAQAKGLETFSAMFRELIVDNQGRTMLAATLETIASGLRDELLHIRSVQQRIRDHGLAPDDLQDSP
jgi:hypothetical protein